MTIIEQIKAEIERRQKENYEQEGSFAAGRVVEDADILSFLSTLESEKPMQEELDKEIGKIWETCEPVDEGMGVETANIHIEQFDYIARHFAQWGAEHLADARKTSPKDLEEAADEYASSVEGDYAFSEGPDHYCYGDLEDAFIAGAKWQADHTPLPEDTVLFNKGVEEGKRLMMEEAVEGWVAVDSDTAGNRRVTFFPKEPVRDLLTEYKYWAATRPNYESVRLNPNAFPNLKWEDEPIKVRIIIVKEDEK